MKKRDNMQVTLGKMSTAIVRGEEDLTAWSDEELLRGQRRDKNGNWSGRKPKVVPKAIHDEWVSRRMAEAHDLLRECTVDAVVVLRDLAMDPDTESSVRIKAVEMILDRTMGKPSEKMQLEVQQRRTLFDQAFDAMIVYDESDLPELDAIEAEVIDDDA